MQVIFEDEILYVCTIALMLMCISIYSWQRKKYRQHLTDLKEITEKRSQHADVNRIYQQTGVKIDDLMAAVNLIMMQTLVPFVVIAYITILIYKQLFWNYTINSFQSIFPTTLRFDLERPSGFLISTIVQIATVHITSEIFLIILMVIAQLRLFEADFILDLKQNLKELNEKMTLGNGNEKLTADDRDKIKKKLVDLMQFYAEAKEFIKSFENTNDPLVFVYILYGATSYTGLLLQMKNILTTGSIILGIIGILQILVPASIALFWLCYFYYFGFRSTQWIEEIGDNIHKLNIAYFQL